MKKVIVLSVLIGMFFFSCQLGTDNTSDISHNEPMSRGGAIINAPGFADFVGNGYAVLETDKPYMGQALNKSGNDSVQFEPSGMYGYEAFLIEKSYDIEEATKLNIGGQIEGVFGVFDISGKATYIKNNITDISSNSVTLLIRMYYDYGTVILNKTTFIDNLKNMLLDNNTKGAFYDTYGTAYSRRTKLGTTCFYAITYSFKNESKENYTNLKAELNASLKVINAKVEGDLDITDLDKYKNRELTISKKFIGTGGFISDIIVDDQASMNALISAFGNYVNNTFPANIDYNNKRACNKIPSFAQEYESYEALAARLDLVDQYLCEIDEFHNKKLTWWKLYSQLDRTRNDVIINAYNLPLDIVNLVNNKIYAAITYAEDGFNKCKNRDANAVYYSSSEYDYLCDLFKIQVESPINLTVIDQGTYKYFTWKNDFKMQNFTLFIDNEEVKSNITGKNYQFLPNDPGVFEWYVLGYSNKGVPMDSCRGSYIVPGFDLDSMHIKNALGVKDSLEFHIVKPYKDLFNPVMKFCVNDGSSIIEKNMGNDDSYIYTFEKANTQYEFYIKCEYNGTTGRSKSLFIKTIPALKLDGTNINGTITNSDGNWYYFDVSNKTGLRFYLDGIGSNSYYCSARLSHSSLTYPVTIQEGRDVYFDAIAAGRYYIQITGYTGINYTFSVKENHETESNNTQGTADECIKGNKSGIPYKGYDNFGKLNNQSDIDYFYMTINSSGTVTIKLTGLNSYYCSWKLEKKYGGTIFSSGSNGVPKTLSLSPGTYYIKVTGYSGIEYKLEID